MDLWQRARVVVEGAAKMSHDLAAETAKKSLEFAVETAKKSKEIAAETASKSKEFAVETAKKSQVFAAEATKTADLLRSGALRAADQIKTSLVVDGASIPSAISSALASGSNADASDLETFGITDELREFVKGITLTTFKDFPMQDEPEISEVSTLSNVRQDLNKWQARHATLVLSNVKEISQLRYELCPRFMKERKFWRIYFILIGTYAAPYERKYMEELRKEEEQKEIDSVKEQSPSSGASVSVNKETKHQSKTSTSSPTEHDLDVFLLGDLGTDEEGPDDGADGSDDDFDKIENTSGLGSDDGGKKM